MLRILTLVALSVTAWSVEISMYGLDTEGRIIESSKVIIPDKEIKSISQVKLVNSRAISIALTEAGGEINNNFTTAHKGKQISVWINGIHMSSPTVIEPIFTNVVISTKLSPEDLSALLTDARR